VDNDHINDESIAPRCAGGTGSADCRERRILAEDEVTLAAILGLGRGCLKIDVTGVLSLKKREGGRN